mmetsp:Transcript_35478/g.55240  ORF Transcript_35478/g.55240 Transcript_35478/m.55240 type:complete len:216 (-) Transcript_35478:206-853(-)
MSSEKFLPLPTGEESAAYAPMSGPGGGMMPTSTSSSSGSSGFLSQLFPPSPGRENHLFCNCCCDVRRATLVVNGITIVWNLLVMLLMFIGFEFLVKNADQIAADMDDDEAANDLKAMASNGSLGWLEAAIDIFFMFSIVLHGFGVYGALKYEVWAIVVAAVAYGIGLAFAVLGLDFMNIFMKGMFLYPHLVLIKEIREGIMTDYNYANVKSCCDC